MHLLILASRQNIEDHILRQLVFRVCHMLTCLFIAALWTPAGKGLTSWLSCMFCFIVFLSLSHIVSLVRCGT